MTDTSTSNRRSGSDRRAKPHRWMPELSEPHRQMLAMGFFLLVGWIGATWYKDVVGLPKELQRFEASIEVKLDTMSVRGQRTDESVRELKTDVRILKETSFSSKDAQDLVNAVTKFTATVEAQTSAIESLDIRLQRLENQ
jgi:hypothetical protein